MQSECRFDDVNDVDDVDDDDDDVVVVDVVNVNVNVVVDVLLEFFVETTMWHGYAAMPPSLARVKPPMLCSTPIFSLSEPSSQCSIFSPVRERHRKNAADSARGPWEQVPHPLEKRQRAGILLPLGKRGL